MPRNLQPAVLADSPRPAKRRRTQVGLMELASGINPDVDIVAIYEIDGSWTADNRVLWLIDLLPAEIPNARILAYGYDANARDQKQLAADLLHENAMNFIVRLALFREKTATADRPVIFVAHSSDGLLLEFALIHDHSCPGNYLKQRAIYQSTHGVAFFGTPQQGFATAELAQPILRIGPFSSPTNNALHKAHGMDVAGVSKRVVPRTSAIIPGTINAQAIGIYNDHIRMVKFPAAYGNDFRTVSTALSLMSKAAYQKKGVRYKITIMEIILTPSQQSALSNLLPVKAAQFDADSRPRCLRGTRVNSLNTISEWAEKDIAIEHPQFFWLFGQAGMGKTTISLTVAGDCQVKGRLGASFFFSRDDAERNDLRLVFPSVAHQLGIFHKPFQKLLAEILERNPTLVQKTPVDQFNKLIIEPLKLCKSFPTSTIIVIDGLDECQDVNPVSTMLSILSSHIHQLPFLKFFIASRPEDHIVIGFRQLNTSSQSIILHEIEDSVVDGDIERYLLNEFSSTADLYPDLVKPDWPSGDSIRSLVGMSGRLFIFAATAMSFILDRAHSDPPKRLAILLRQSPATYSSTLSPFTLLDRLYLQVLHHAFPKQTTSDHFVLLKMVLGSVVHLRDPLSPGALEMLLSLEGGIVRTTLCRLHSIMVVPATDEHPIRFIHPSFFDFATSRCLHANLRIDPSVCHEQLAIACFKQMKGLKRNICLIQDASKLNSEIENLAERIELYMPLAMQYACRHWSFHLCIAGGNTLQCMFGEFCREHILYWMEALNLLGCLQEGIHHLRDVLKFLNVRIVPQHVYPHQTGEWESHIIGTL